MKSFDFNEVSKKINNITFELYQKQHSLSDKNKQALVKKLAELEKLIKTF